MPEATLASTLIIFSTMVANLRPQTATSPPYHVWSRQVADLAAAVRALLPLAAELGLPNPSAAAWYGGLFQKLLPQVEKQPFLIIAVAGGTNTGKSLIFNHLAHSAVSRAHPNATQTRHPVCLLPKGFSDKPADLFPDFEICPWSGENDPLNDGPDHLLFVREDLLGRQSSRLLLLDTPDVDGTLKTNWRRAELVCHAADVLVCILTQQKYNDAAIRDYFRAAAKAEKTVIVVFNMVHWPRQRELCDGWVKHFSLQTGVQPLFVYAVPWDPDAAEHNHLPFYPLSAGATDLRDDLAELQFDNIKIRSLAGSLRQVVEQQQGLPAWLGAIDQRAEEYQGALLLLDSEVRKRPFELPRVPRELVWDEIWKWLSSRRANWERAINEFWNTPSRWLISLIGKNSRQITAKESEQYRRDEYDCMQQILTERFDQLTILRDAGSSVLKCELGNVLGGSKRVQLFEELQRRHSETELITESYRQYIRSQLDEFANRRPELVSRIRNALKTVAVVRPIFTLAVTVVGLPHIHILAENLAANVLIDHAGGTVVALTGDNLATYFGEWTLERLIARIFNNFYEERCQLLTSTLDEVVLGPVVERLRILADASDDSHRKWAAKLIDELRTSLNQSTTEQNIT